MLISKLLPVRRILFKELVRKTKHALGVLFLTGSGGALMASEAPGHLAVMEQFAAYKQDTEQQFLEYEAALDKAYKEFAGQIEEAWGDQQLTDNHRWVQYSGDLKARTIVDYKSNQLVLEYTDVAIDETTEEDIEKGISELMVTSLQGAIENDQVLVQASVHSGVPLPKPELDVPMLSWTSLQSQDTAVDAPLVAEKNSAETENSAAVATNSDVKALISQAAKDYQVLSRRLTVVIELPEEFGVHKAKRFWPHTAKYAKQWKLEPALVMAIIHTESSFNPMARSRIPAYGLMQIVPRTAGRDASKVIYGKSKLFDSGYLFNPENNIKVGAAYLHVLTNRYLKGIHNPESRLYCAVAAYNTGTANVASAFIGQKSMQKAFSHINHLEPSEVYDTLANNLPYDETRSYLRKVIGRYQYYTN